MMWDPPWQCHKPRIWSNSGMVVTTVYVTIMFATLRSIRLSSQRKVLILTYSDPPRWGCGGKQEVLAGMWPCFAAHAPSDQASEDVESSQIVRDSWMMVASLWAGTPWEHGKAMLLELYVHFSPDTLLRFCKRPWLCWCLGYPLFSCKHSWDSIACYWAQAPQVLKLPWHPPCGAASCCASPSPPVMMPPTWWTCRSSWWARRNCGEYTKPWIRIRMGRQELMCGWVKTYHTDIYTVANRSISAGMPTIFDANYRAPGFWPTAMRTLMCTKG